MSRPAFWPAVSGPLPRPLLLALAGLLLSGGAAQARTVKIISAQNLELRKVDDQDIVVISGDAVELRLDDDVVRAQRVEFNRTNRTLTLVGHATYHTAKDGQDMVGDDLVVNLGSEALTGQDVLISTGSLEIRGNEIERVPGQLRATGGYFTPCSRCGRTPNDYAFRAEQLVMYPGDRLIAYRAQLLLADHPVLYLPVVVLPLNDETRQPKFGFGKSDTDGYTVSADLPFAVGSSVLGTTLLRYYQNRGTPLGGGVDLHAYAPTDWIDRADLYTLGQPKPVAADGTKPTGYDLDINFTVKGRLQNTPALRPPDYTLTVRRKDIGRLPTDPEYGLTTVDFGFKADYPRFTAAVSFNNRYGPEPTVALYTPLKKPEIDLNPKPFTVGPLSFDFDFVAGQYTAASNPSSRLASAAGLNYTTSRLEENHSISYVSQPWQGGEIQLTNTFVGHYYGNGARTVRLNLAGKMTQRWGVGNSFSVSQAYLRNEGTSPFAFDVVSYQLSAPLILSLNTVPVAGASFGVTYTRDAFVSRGAIYRNQHLVVSAGLNRTPVSFSSSLDYNFPLDEVDSSSLSVSVGDSESGKLVLVPAQAAVPATPTTAAQPARPAYYRRSSAWPFPKLNLSASGSYNRFGGLQPLTLTATVTDQVRANNFSVTGIYDLQGDQYLPDQPDAPGKTWMSFALRYAAISSQDTVLNPVSISGNETLTLRSPSLSGNHQVTWRGYTLSTSHNLNLNQPDTAQDSGTVNFSVGTIAGKATNWNLTYGGPYDLRRQGFSRPLLTGSLGLTRPGQRLAASASISMPGLDQTHTEVKQAALSGVWQQGRVALSGQMNYSRFRPSYGDDIPTDTWTFQPLQVGVGLGSGPKPGAYLTASLRQTLTYVGGVRQNPDEPLAPVIGLTIDRCCWVMQGEVDLQAKRFRIALGMPGQLYPLFQLDPDKVSLPLISNLTQSP